MGSSTTDFELEVVYPRRGHTGMGGTSRLHKPVAQAIMSTTTVVLESLLRFLLIDRVGKWPSLIHK